MRELQLYVSLRSSEGREKKINTHASSLLSTRPKKRDSVLARAQLISVPLGVGESTPAHRRALPGGRGSGREGYAAQAHYGGRVCVYVRV